MAMRRSRPAFVCARTLLALALSPLLSVAAAAVSAGTSAANASTAAGLTTAIPLDFQQARTSYSLSDVLYYTVVYFGAVAGLLLLLSLAVACTAKVRRGEWKLQPGECLVPRWFNASLPRAWITAWSSPSRKQVRGPAALVANLARVARTCVIFVRDLPTAVFH